MYAINSYQEQRKMNLHSNFISAQILAEDTIKLDKDSNITI